MRDFDPELDDADASPEEEARRATAAARRDGREERARQEVAYEASRARVEERQQARSAARARTLRLALAATLGLGLLGAVGYAVFLGVEGQGKALGRVEALAAPLGEAGFRVEQSLASQRGRALSAKATVDGCVAFVAAKGATPTTVVVTRSSGGVVSGPRVVVCSCGAEDLEVKVPDVAEGDPSGTAVLGVLRGTAAATGGVVVLREARMDGVVVAEGAPACDAEQLDAWLVRVPVDPLPGEPPVGLSAWMARGYRVSSRSPEAKPWAPLPHTEDGCVLTVPDEASVRVRFEGKELTQGAAVCFGKAQPVTLHKPNSLPLVVLERKGGSPLDFYEAVGAPPRHAAYVFEDAWRTMAERVLVASGVNPREIESPDKVQRASKHRLLAILREPSDSIAKDQPLRGLACSPKAADDLRSPVAVCILPRDIDAPVLRTKNHVSVAPMPAFLAAFSEARDERLLAAMGDLLVLARRLAAKGLEPTLLAGVRETAGGAEVTGRAGEQLVCAVTLMPSPPYVVPLSPDGKPWSIDAEPRLFGLQPGARATVRGAVAGAPAARRTIVFRAHEAAK